ncbi:MAG TPA: hypothetical protein VFV38_29870 [Ktedonobacteraceae bacterium]|nr:hypothetical protein [Ktedonobacteraceae bacterium]
MKPRMIHVGKGSILVDNEDFINGYQAGVLACQADCRRFAINNENVGAILTENLENPDKPEQYRIGYCIGWVVTLATKGNTIMTEASREGREYR